MRLLTRQLVRIGEPHLERRLADWANGIVLPGRLPGHRFPRKETLEEIADMLEANRDAWTAQWKAEGRVEGRAEGRRELVERLIRVRFGAQAATALARFLADLQSAEALDKVGDLVVTCPDADAFLAATKRL